MGRQCVGEKRIVCVCVCARENWKAEKGKRDGLGMEL